VSEPTVVDDLLSEWDLHSDGEVLHTPNSLVLPVRSRDHGPAVLKISAPDIDGHAHIVLRRWNGHGAVRLLRADPHRRVVLLERLHHGSLADEEESLANEVITELYGRLHIPALPQLPSLPELLGGWADELSALPRNAAIPHRHVERAVSLCRDLVSRPAPVVLHGNLHDGNVLAGTREAWLAISPAAVNGDPAYEVAPLLFNRWHSYGRDVRAGIRWRLYTIAEAAGWDEDLVRAWATIRVVRGAAHALTRGAGDAELTAYVTLAKAVQD